MFFQAISLLAVTFVFMQNMFSPIDYSNAQSLLLINQNATLITSVDMTGVTGTVVLGKGASIEGTAVLFSNGVFGDTQDSPVQIKGTFSIDTSGVALDTSRVGSSPIDFWQDNLVTIKTDVLLTTTWAFHSNAKIEGRNTFDLGDPNALVIVYQNSTLNLEGLTLDNFDINKFILMDSTSTVKFIDTSVVLATDITSSTGNIVIEGTSGFVMNQHDVLFSDSATFTVAQGASFWLDTRGSVRAPIFSFVITDTASSSGTKLVSAIDNTFIRIAADTSQIVDPGAASLVSGTVQPVVDPTSSDPGAGASVVVSSNSVISPDQQIIVSDNIEVQGGGSSITFAGKDQAQVVVDAGKTATFANVELLRISQNTFDLNSASTMRFNNNMVLEFVEDVVFDKGSFLVLGNASQVLMRGLGGTKKITFKGSAEGDSPFFNLGTNKLILEDIELVGLNYFSRNTATVSGVAYEGKIVLVGQSRVNLNKDTDMHFLIRGSNSRIVFQENNLILNGQIRFDDYADSVLNISFSASSDLMDLAFALGPGALRLGSKDSQSGIIINNDVVTVINMAGSSFVTSGNTFLGGGVVKIAQNPINQESAGFSLMAGLDLQSDLPFPINFSEDIATGRNDDFWNDKEFLFCDDSFKRAVPRPSLVVRTGMTGANLKNTIAVRPGAEIKGLSPSKTSPLKLIFVGNSSATTTIRREGQVASIARAVSSSTSTDTMDTFKTTDTLYVTGVGNKITITGLLAYQGSIVLDSGAELIFSFDESVDSPKAISFSNPLGHSTLTIPATASIVFQGNGSVFFGNNMKCDFLGTPISQQQALGNGLFRDDRPSLIFRNYAQLVLDDPLAAVTLSGNGKLLFQNGAQLTVEAGRLQVGYNLDDFFDLTFDKNASMIAGLPEVTASVGIISLAKGTFNLTFDRLSTLLIKNGGVVEIGLLNNLFTYGQLNSMTFERDSILNMLSGGILSFGQESLSVSSNNSSKFSWNNVDGKILGTGAIQLRLKSSTDPFISALLQPRYFKASSGGLSSFEVFKGLARNTDALITASDFVDSVNKQSKLITKNNVIVALADGDILRAEGPDTGNVYGTSASGQRFFITSEGIKTFL